MVSMGRHGPLQWGFHQGNWRKMEIQSTERCGDTYGFKLRVLCGDWWFILMFIYCIRKRHFSSIFHCDAFTHENGTMHFLKTNQHFAGLWFLHGWTWGRLVTDVPESRFWTMDMWVCLKILGKILWTCDGESSNIFAVKLCKTRIFRRKTGIFHRYTAWCTSFFRHSHWVIKPTSQLDEKICWAPLSWDQCQARKPRFLNQAGHPCMSGVTKM